MEESKNQTPIEYKPGDTYEVPAEGSLGLLALGYRGLIAWREAQKKAKVEGELNEDKPQKNQTENK